jgi:hypothetical protein
MNKSTLSLAAMGGRLLSLAYGIRLFSLPQIVDEFHTNFRQKILDHFISTV